MIGRGGAVVDGAAPNNAAPDNAAVDGVGVGGAPGPPGRREARVAPPSP